MDGKDVFFFSSRSRKHREMAQSATCEKARAKHKRLAGAYADQAALAVLHDS